MRILITGASGYLGQYLVNLAAHRYCVAGSYFSNQPMLPPNIDHIRLDIRDSEKVAGIITKLSPDAIIHTAALNSGNDADEFELINAHGSAHIAKAADRIGARLIYVSTDTVHNGRNAPYEDSAEPSPINAYGRSKANAEKYVTQYCANVVIVRTSLIYDTTAMPRSTANFANMLRNNQPVRLFSDVVRQPVQRNYLAESLLKLLESHYRGYINVAGSQSLSRDYYERCLLKFWNIDTKKLVKSTKAAVHHLSVPLDLRLSIRKAKEILGIDPVGFEQSLAATSRR